MTNGAKMLGVLVFIVALFAACYSYANAAPITDEEMDKLICDQLALGQEPGVIANLIGSDPRVAWPMLRVADAIRTCG